MNFLAMVPYVETTVTVSSQPESSNVCAAVALVSKVMFHWGNISVIILAETVTVVIGARLPSNSLRAVLSLDSLDIETSTIALPSSTPMLSFDLDDSGIVETLGNLGNRCTNDDYCRQRVLQSHCYNRTCTCLHGFIPLDSFTCVKGKVEQ